MWFFLISLNACISWSFAACSTEVNKSCLAVCLALRLRDDGKCGISDLAFRELQDQALRDIISHNLPTWGMRL